MPVLLTYKEKTQELVTCLRVTQLAGTQTRFYGFRIHAFNYNTN